MLIAVRRHLALACCALALACGENSSEVAGIPDSSPDLLSIEGASHRAQMRTALDEVFDELGLPGADEVTVRSVSTEVLRTSIRDALQRQWSRAGWSDVAAQQMGVMGALSLQWVARYDARNDVVLIDTTSLDKLAKRLAPELREGIARVILRHEAVHAAARRLFAYQSALEAMTDMEASRRISTLLEGHAQHVTRALCNERGDGAAFDGYLDVLWSGRQYWEPDQEFGMKPHQLRAAAATGASDYVDGERFVRDLLREGGESALAAAFASPPLNKATLRDAVGYAALLASGAAADPDAEDALVARREAELEELALTVTLIAGASFESVASRPGVLEYELAFDGRRDGQPASLLSGVRDIVLLQASSKGDVRSPDLRVGALRLGSVAEARTLYDALRELRSPWPFVSEDLTVSLEETYGLEAECDGGKAWLARRTAFRSFSPEVSERLRKFLEIELDVLLLLDGDTVIEVVAEDGILGGGRLCNLALAVREVF